MTTLRDRIAALVEKACRHDPKDNHTFEDDADRILALFRDEAPPSAIELMQRHDGVANRPPQLDWLECYQEGYARSEFHNGPERAELQRRLESAERAAAATDSAWALRQTELGEERLRLLDQRDNQRLRAESAERERAAALSELRQGSMRLAVELCRQNATCGDADNRDIMNTVADWLEAEARKAGANG